MTIPLRVFVEGVVIVGGSFELVDRFGPALHIMPTRLTAI